MAQIYHLNLVNFACAVETTLQRKALNGRPFAVSMNDDTGLIIDHSEEAFQAGIRRFMPVTRAKKALKGLRLMLPSFIQYERAKRAITNEIKVRTPFFSYQGEGNYYFMFPNTASNKGLDDVFTLRRLIKEKYRLSSALGLGSNLLTSSVASRLVKPIGFNTINKGEEMSILAPLSLDYLNIREKHLRERLYHLGIYCIGDLQTFKFSNLLSVLPKIGRRLYHQARGLESNFPMLSYNRTTMSKRTYVTPSNDQAVLKDYLKDSVNQLCDELDDQHLRIEKLKLTAQYIDLSESNTASKVSSTRDRKEIFSSIVMLLDKLLLRRLRLVSFTIFFEGLCKDSDQLELFT